MNENHIMFKLFKSFELNNIYYLHFKSNTNLANSFSGKGDFDVLVDKNEIIKVENLISKNNGKRHNPIQIGDYAGVDNWLVFDDSDGTIYHLHLHYQLVTGKKFVKDYVIPWNELLFSTRVKDPLYGIYVTNPNVELLLLAFRSVLKAGFFDYLLKIIGCYKLGVDMHKEWEDMYHKSSPLEMKRIIGLICPEHASELEQIMLKEKLTSHDYLWLHRTIRSTMKVHRRFSSVKANLLTLVYQAEDYFRKRWNHYMRGLIITRKVSLQGGLILAFVGIDGAGKSTISNEICKWIMHGKIEAKRFYMGAGDGSTTFFASIVKSLIKYNHNGKKAHLELNHNKSPQKKSENKISFFDNPIKFLKSCTKIRMINSIQKNNYHKIKRMYHYKLNGGISVLDRWPQIEFDRRNDGAKIVTYRDVMKENWYLRKKIKDEQQYLNIVKTIKPDIIFRLNISLDTCLERKPEENTDRDAFMSKLDELKQINFQGARIVEIDAEQPYDEELLLIKQILWKYI